MILKDETRRQLVIDLIKKDMLIPEGLVIAPKLWKKSIELYDEDKFGKTDEIVCPFLNKTNSYCNIHPYRNGVCSTFSVILTTVIKPTSSGPMLVVSQVKKQHCHSGVWSKIITPTLSI